ncbi:MAG: Gfo/Idh/MocA family oxidoreductase [Candidatus Magasanikbacteria bacterium]|nr:Gfo/Idh/MocA family oxidoreductase [Candidatus Magasanikbacteria bacterium]
MYKGLIIGAGNIGYGFQNYGVGFPTTHFEAYMQNSELELVGISESDPELLLKLKKNHNFSIAASYMALLRKESPDIVSICTPDETHYDILCEVLSCDFIKGIWCEKPVTLSLAQARDIERRSAKKHIPVLVNFIRRYDPFYTYLKDHMNDLLGEIQAVTVYYSGGLVTNGSHVCDLLSYWFGDCKAVSARTLKNEIFGQAEYENGMIAHLVPMDGKKYPMLEFNIFGTKARLDTINKPFGAYDYRYFKAEESQYLNISFVSRKEERPIPDDFSRSYMSNALDDLLKCVKTGIEPKSSVRSALSSLEMISGLWSSAGQGNRVTFPLENENIILNSGIGDASLWKKN